MNKINKFLVLIVFCLSSCFGKVEDNIEQFFDNHEFNSIINNSTKVEVKRNSSKYSMNDSTFYSICQIKNRNKILEFREIIEKSPITGYCCCPEPNLSLSFFKENKLLDVYYVNTTEFKDKIRIFDSGFQYSYLIEKENWPKYLTTEHRN